MPNLYVWLIFIIFAGSSVFLLSLSKVGFGGGAGNLATPLMALVISAQTSLGIILPLLCICDIFALYYYRGKWNYDLLRQLSPFSILGVIAGSLMLGSFPDRLLKQVIGILAISFALIQIIREKIMTNVHRYIPRPWHGYLVGSITGITSTIAHQGGPVATIFLLTQKLTKEVFMGTITVIFAIINAAKLPFYLYLHIINFRSLELTLLLIPMAGLGAILGRFLNRRVPDEMFVKIVYILLILTGVQLLLGLSPRGVQNIEEKLIFWLSIGLNVKG